MYVCVCNECIQRVSHIISVALNNAHERERERLYSGVVDKKAKSREKVYLKKKRERKKY